MKPPLPGKRVAVALDRPRPDLPILTSLRFFAAIEVVVFHLSVSWSRPVLPGEFVRGLASGGYQAVTFFFLLSGFVLAYTHAGAGEREAFNLPVATFWRRRFARIAPAYYLALLIAVPLLLKDARQGELSNGSLIMGALFVLLLLQAWWPPFTMLWLDTAWSLSVEAFLYALFPWLANRTASLPRTPLMLATYGLIVWASVYRAEHAANFPSQEMDSILLFKAYGPIWHLLPFFFGMLLARLYLFGSRLSGQQHAALLMIGLCAVVLVFGSSGHLPKWALSDAVLVPLFGLVVFGGAGAAPVVTPLALPALVLLGEASYSIYILHVPINLWWIWLTRDVMGWSLPRRLDLVLATILIIAVSLLLYRYVELPLRQWLAGGQKRLRATKQAA